MMHGRRTALLASGLLYIAIAHAGASGIRIVLRETIPVGRQPHNLTLTPDKREIYVTNLRDDSVSVISWPGRRVSTLQVCDEPWVVAAAPDGGTVFVGCRGGVAAISTRTKKVNVIQCCGWVWDLAITKDGRRVYIAAQRGGLFRMDARTLHIEMVNSTEAAMKLALTPDGKFLYVNYQSSGPGGRPGHDAIGQFDTGSDRLIRAIQDLPNVGGALAISPDGKRLWANGTDACLSTRYDHQGCPMVPATIVNVLSLPDHRILRQIVRTERFVRQTVSFSQTGRYVVVSGEDPALYDAMTFRALATASGYNAVDWLFLDSDDLSLATLYDENKVGLFPLVQD